MRRYLKNKKVLKDCKIYQMLLTQSKKKHLSFHTPGHKIGKFDITELSFSDNLSAPKGCILQAEQDITKILGAQKSFILTDGSTSGVLSMLHVVKSMGKKTVAVTDDAHKSVYNGCALLGLTPLLLGLNEKTNVKLLDGADALLLTSPSYYGKIPDLKRARRYCDEKGTLLLIDGAHGGHLREQKELYAGAYADLWVDGAHKSLPALTQGAIVSTSKKELVEPLQNAVEIFRTSSPSYPIMASVEYAVKYPRNVLLEQKVRSFQAKYPDRVLKNEDWTKLCAYFGRFAFEVEKRLEGMGIYPEFCDGEFLTFYLSPATRIKDFEKLSCVLKRLFQEKNGGRYEFKGQEDKNEPTVSELKETEWVELEKAENRVCAGNCGLFPPCTPLIKEGERVTEEKIALLKKANNVFGIRENRIMVYKNER